jgi:hypothetical protein
VALYKVAVRVNAAGATQAIRAVAPRAIRPANQQPVFTEARNIAARLSTPAPFEVPPARAVSAPAISAQRLPPAPFAASGGLQNLEANNSRSAGELLSRFGISPVAAPAAPTAPVARGTLSPAGTAPAAVVPGRRAAVAPPAVAAPAPPAAAAPVPAPAPAAAAPAAAAPAAAAAAETPLGPAQPLSVRKWGNRVPPPPAAPYDPFTPAVPAAAAAAETPLGPAQPLSVRKWGNRVPPPPAAPYDPFTPAVPAAAPAAAAPAAAAETPTPGGWGWKAPAAVLGTTALLGGTYMAGRAQANEHDPRYQKYAGLMDRVGGAVKAFRSFQPAQHALAGPLPTTPPAQGMMSQLRGRWNAGSQAYQAERAADQAVSSLKTQQAGLRKTYDALPAAEQATFVANQKANPSPGWGVTPQQHLLSQNLAVPERYQTPQAPQSSSFGGTFGWKAPVAIGGTVLAGTAAYRAGQNASEQEARMRDLNSARQHQLYSAPPSMTVLASYDEFAKTAMPRPVGPIVPQSTGGVPNQMDRALRDAVAREMAQSMVSRPINALGDLVQKKLYDEPKYRATYDKAIESDPMLKQYAQEKPDAMLAVHKSLTRFAPSVAKDPAATRSFLRSSMMAGGELDFATIRLLAETEKFVQNAKGKGLP